MGRCLGKNYHSKSKLNITSGRNSTRDHPYKSNRPLSCDCGCECPYRGNLLQNKSVFSIKSLFSLFRKLSRRPRCRKTTGTSNNNLNDNQYNRDCCSSDCNYSNIFDHQNKPLSSTMLPSATEAISTQTLLQLSIPREPQPSSSSPCPSADFSNWRKELYDKINREAFEHFMVYKCGALNEEQLLCAWNQLPKLKRMPYYWLAFSNYPVSENPSENFRKSVLDYSNMTSLDIETLWADLPYNERLPFLVESLLAEYFRGDINLTQFELRDFFRYHQRRSY